jgi:hypothetical protein
MPACFDAEIRPSFLPGYVVGFAFGGGEFSSLVFLSVGIFAPCSSFVCVIGVMKSPRRINFNSGAARHHLVCNNYQGGDISGF